MESNRYVLIIYGSLCAGKTSVVDLMVEAEPALMRVARDTFKRFISDYGKTHNYNQLVNQMEFRLVSMALEHGLSVVIEGNIMIQESLRDNFQRLAATHNIRFIEINLEAPLEVLRRRFQERVSEAETTGNKLFCRTEERMLFHYNKYLEHKNHNIPTIDTSQTSVPELYEKIQSLIYSQD